MSTWKCTSCAKKAFALHACAVATHELEYHRTRINALRISPDDRFIAVGDAGREIKVWEIGKDEPVVTRKWLAHQSTVTTISWSPEGTRLVSGSVDGRIVVWNMNAPREIHERPGQHPGGVFRVEWTDNNVVYSYGDDACIRETQLVMWNVCFKDKTHSIDLEKNRDKTSINLITHIIHQ